MVAYCNQRYIDVIAPENNVHARMRLDSTLQGVSVEKLEDLYATAMDYGITLVTISHEPGTLLHYYHDTRPCHVA